MVDKSVRLTTKANITLFALVIIFGSVGFLIAPKQAVSIIEKRRLAPPPEWTVRAIFSGKTGKTLTRYYSDQFEFRDRFLALADQIKSARGLKTGDYEVVATGNGRTSSPTLAAKAATGGQDAVRDDEGDYQDIRSVIIYRNKAVQISIGSKATAERFADVVNAYHRALGPAVRLYMMAIPVGSDFYLPHAIANGENRELANIRELYANLSEGIAPVQDYQALATHTGEYIYFRTDHHWTASGAYWAYRSFAEVAGLTPIGPRAMVKHTIPSFLGSLYSYTRSDALKDHLDYVNYFIIPYKTTELVYRGHNKPPLHARLYETTAKGRNAYSVFIGGDYPLVRILSDAPGNRKILVIKDSFGNALVPYLAANYREVWVIDYRSFSGSVTRLVRDNGIRELLIAHNNYVYNGQFAARRDSKMLTDTQNDAQISPAR